MGAFEGSVTTADNIVDLIYDDIKTRTGMEFSRLPLRHMTIYGNDGDRFEIDGFEFEIREGVFATPSNDRGDLIAIKNVKSMQDTSVAIYYLR